MWKESKFKIRNGIYNYRNNDKFFSLILSISKNAYSQNKNIKGISKVENYNYLNKKESNDLI